MENCFPFLRLLLTHLKVCYWSLQIYTFVVTGEDQKPNLIPKRVATKIPSIKVPFRDRKSCASPKRAPSQVTNQQFFPITTTASVWDTFDSGIGQDSKKFTCNKCRCKCNTKEPPNSANFHVRSFHSAP